MAVEFNAPSLTRTSEYLLDPREVTVKPELNGRHDLPDIDDLVNGFMELGQLQPCLIGRDGGTPVLYAGHRRWRAALKITNDKLLPGGVPFKLRCVYFKGDERTAFLATVAENHDRKDTTEMDDAYNIAKMQRWGMSDEEIAGVYRKKRLDGKPDTGWVQKRASLVDLCDEAAQAVREGRVKPTAAVAIAKLAKEAQREIIATAPAGRVITSAKTVAKPAVPEGGGSNNQKPPKITVEKCRSVLQEYIDMDIPAKIQGMTCENAIRTILGEILDEIGGPL